MEETDSKYDPKKMAKVEEKDAARVYSIVAKLVAAVEKKTESDITKDRVQELEILWDYCASENPLVSVTACHGIVSLVEENFLPVKKTLSAITAKLCYAQCIVGITNAVVHLLIYDLKSQLKENRQYECPYASRELQHPLVCILQIKPKEWRYVLNHMTAVCNSNDQDVLNNSVELLKPVFHFILYAENSVCDTCRHESWTLLVQSYHNSNGKFLIENMMLFLSWGNNRVLELTTAVNVMCDAVLSSKNLDLVSVMAPVVAVTVHRLIECAFDPQPMLGILKKLTTVAYNTHTVILAMLSDSITKCPSVYLPYLLDICLWLLKQGKCTLDISWMYVCNLLPWLMSNPDNKVIHLASSIISHVTSASGNPSSTLNLIKNPYFPNLMAVESRLVHAVHLSRLSETLRNNRKATLLWLDNNKDSKTDWIQLYFRSLLIGRQEPDIKLAVIEILNRSEPHLAAHNLTLNLYQLSREKDPEVQMALLKMLPSTGVDKNNVGKIMTTIEALSQGQSALLKTFAVDLYLKLWKTQDRSYHQLIGIIGHPVNNLSPMEAWEMNIAQAVACKQICTLAPEKYGKELVKYISPLISRCSDPQGSVATSLCLEALINLGKEEIVDVYSIWKLLSPRLMKDRRPAVVCSFCGLAELVMTQPFKQMTNDIELCMEQVIKWLWHNITSNPHLSVVNASFITLSKTRVELIKFKWLPEPYRRGIKLPPQYCKTPSDAARRPEDVLDYVPGKSWVLLLQNVRTDAHDAACETVGCWLSQEISAYRIGMYNTQRGEPSDYSYLQDRSICRGMCEFLQTLSADSTDENLSTGILCSQVLTKPLPKVLPPRNWNFLISLKRTSFSRLSENVIRIAARQAQISSTARSIIEEHISGSTTSEDHVRMLYSVLGDLGRGVQPNILRPFLERTINRALNSNDKKLMSMILDCIRITLLNEKVHDANQKLLEQQVESLWNLLGPDYELLEEFLSCAACLPVSSIERMTSPSLMWEVTSAHLQKSAKLRAHMSTLPDANNPLVWFNEPVESAVTNISEQPLVLELLCKTLKKLIGQDKVWTWLQELMGQIHSVIVNEQSGAEFLVSIFMNSVDITSGYSCLESDDFSLIRFPQALYSLVKQYGEAKQMAEWLKHVHSQAVLPPDVSSALKLASQSVLLLV